jgi:hypothetical protein
MRTRQSHDFKVSFKDRFSRPRKFAVSSRKAANVPCAKKTGSSPAIGEVKVRRPAAALKLVKLLRADNQRLSVVEHETDSSEQPEPGQEREKMDDLPPVVHHDA